MSQGRRRKKLNKDKLPQLSLLVKDQDLWLGLLTFLAIIAGLYLVFVQIIDQTPKRLTENFFAAPKITPVAEIRFARLFPSPTPSPTPAVKKDEQGQEQQQISNSPQTLPNDKFIRVNKGDNFWKIAKRACGNPKNYLKIQQDNKYKNRALKEGETIKVKCG